MCRSARKDKAQKACVRACVRVCMCVCVRVCAMHRGEMNVRFALRMGNTPHLIGQDHVGSTEPSVCEPVEPVKLVVAEAQRFAANVCGLL